MASREITMPQLGETVTEGTITRWLKQVGEEIKADDLLFEVSTDKVDSEVPSPAGGFLVDILVPEGETVPVGTPIAVIGDAPGEGGGATKDETPAEAPSEVPADSEPTPPADAAPEPAPPAAPAAPPPPAPAPTSGDGNGAKPPAAGESQVLSPVVRRLMAEYGVDPSEIEGTGTGGRITRNDVLTVIERRGGDAPRPQAAPPPAQAPAPAQEAAPPTTPAPAPTSAPAPARAAARAEGDEVVALSNIRKRTAEHMVRSKATSPHVMMSVEVDFENVERVRAAHKESWRAEESFGLTYLPFIARSACDAIADFPHVNASIDGENLVVHHGVNLGIAVDLDFQGLVVPVVRDADSLRFRHLARTIRDLAERARSKQLSPDDIQGGTFTITNPGPFGTYLSAPIINQPQVAILSTEGVKKRPVVVETGDGDAIVIHHTGVLAQSFDHRAFDGAYAASFLGRIKEILEQRDWEPELG